MAAVAVPLTALLLAATPAEGQGGELYVHVQPWSDELEGTPVFLDHAQGSRLAPLDRTGTAHVARLPPGDYRITLPSAPGTVICRWSPGCGPVHVAAGAVVAVTLLVLRPARVSSSGVPPPSE